MKIKVNCSEATCEQKQEVSFDGWRGSGVEDGGYIGITLEQREKEVEDENGKKTTKKWGESWSDYKFGIFKPRIDNHSMYDDDEKTKDRGVNTHANTLMEFETVYDTSAEIDNSPWFVNDHAFTDGDYDAHISGTICRNYETKDDASVYGPEDSTNAKSRLEEMAITDEDWNNTHEFRYWYTKSEAKDVHKT